MTAQEVVNELKTLGSASTKNTLMKHGAREPFYGVKVEELKKIEKRIKKDYQLSMDLFDTGISDAMYLAGLIADPAKMTIRDLQHWADNAYWYMLSEYTVAWTAAESQYGMELALQWIDSQEEKIACSGWATLSNIVLLKKDEDLDLDLIATLLQRIEKTIQMAPNRVRHMMNAFVIAAGSGIISLKDQAIATAEKMGKVHVDMGGTACKVPDAVAYIRKVEAKGYIGKKRKMAKC